MAKNLLEAYEEPWVLEQQTSRWSRRGDTSEKIKDGNARPGAVSPAIGVKGWKSKAPDQVKTLNCSPEQEASMCAPGEECED